MSHLAHPNVTIPHVRLRRTAWFVAALLAAAIALTLILVAGGDEQRAADVAPASLSVDGVRYDGGPEEGTAALFSRDLPPGIRYDGGPEEGAAATSIQQDNPGVRYDGGPEEGTAAIGR